MPAAAQETDSNGTPQIGHRMYRLQSGLSLDVRDELVSALLAGTQSFMRSDDDTERLLAKMHPRSPNSKLGTINTTGAVQRPTAHHSFPSGTIVVLKNGKVLDARRYGYKAWPLRLKREPTGSRRMPPLAGGVAEPGLWRQI